MHGQTMRGGTEEYIPRHKQFRKAKLRWRISRGARKLLGWIPFKATAATCRNGQLRYAGQVFSVGDSDGLGGYQLRSGNFSRMHEARGTPMCVWKLRNPNQREQPRSGWIGGLKDFAALSPGEKFEAQRIDRRGQQELTVAQQANKKDRVKAMHAQMGHRRKDVLHKLST